MGELGSGNGSSYPTALDTDASIEVDSPSASATLARAAVPNDLAAAVIAIETELGLLPKGAYASIRAKLDDMMALTGNQTAAGVKILSGSIIVGDPGTESTGININGTTYESTFKVSDINGTNYAQTILHRHSTTLEPLIVGARANDNTSAHTSVTNGQALFSLYGVGYAGSNYKLFGYFKFMADAAGTVSNTSAPGKIIIGVTPDGSATPVDAITITNDGKTTFSCVTDATSSTAAGTVISGGLAVAKKINLGDNIVMASGKGIDFSATADGSGTVTSELFNDYESGTFTPTVLGSGTAGTPTYVSQIGTYTKIGNRVLAQIYISWSAIGGAPTGGQLVGGLPYASNSTSVHHAGIAIGYCDSLAMTAGYVATAYLPPNDTKINMQQYPTGGGASIDVPVDNAGSLILSGHYYV